MAITGGRTGVRGFVNAVQFGDSAQVLRTEVESLAWSGNWNGAVLQPYAFYDVGQKSGGNDMQSLTLASAGFGLRLAPVKVEGFSADVFAARKTQGSELDLTPASRSVVNENTLWATVTYRF
jgi:hemolysin activation/secretion protein